MTGESKTVPANMTYKEWYEENVANNPRALTEEKKIKNKASDKNELKKYRSILGDEVPKHIDDFQELKYNNTEKWNVIKCNYRKINAYNKIVINEPTITKDLQDIAKTSGYELVGLDFRLKSKDSYLRKVNTDSNNSLDVKIIDETIAGTNDVIRYTYQAPHEELVDKYFEINKLLSEKGYE
ncbi:hypothetical protein [Clostridium thermarum]|uniref:hypothetical protein n=1 Tax=Clostridium thermarum TaxID=1716543 RepID=UPI001124C265|nr:hypothetical protein [Clostridium thermarum]